MASGSKCVTNTAAIPEFVDDRTGILCEPESYEQLAQAIEDVYKGTKDFKRLSKNASDRINHTTCGDLTIPKELTVIRDNCVQFNAREQETKYIAIYGDVNPNIMDGSSTWLSSVTKSLCGENNDVIIHVYLKTPIINLEILEPLLSLA